MPERPLISARDSAMHEMPPISTRDSATQEPSLLLTRRARPRYTIEEKLAIVRFAQTHSMKETCDRYGVARSSVHLWSIREEHLLVSLHGQQHKRQISTTRHVRPSTNAATPEPEAITSKSTALDTTQHLVTAQRSLTRTETHDNHITEAIPTRTAQVPARPPNIMLVGYQGTEGSFSHAAAQLTFDRVPASGLFPSEAIKQTGYPQVPHLLDALSRCDIDYAVVSTDVLLSNVHQGALDRLVMLHIVMIAEVLVAESVSVCALPGTKLCDADCVISDVSTLQRYEEYILHIESLYGKKVYRQATWDSAACCEIIKQERAHSTLVLCKASAAIAHGLIVLQEHALGSPSHTRYTILARHGTILIDFADIPRQLDAGQQSKHCTVLVKSTGRAILDVVSAFAYRRLDIITFYTRGGAEERGLPSYVISYRTSNDPAIEAGLRTHLVAAAERVIILGIYPTYML